MELIRNGVTVRINPAELGDDQLIGLAQEISDVARERGLELPFAAGIIAVESVMQVADTTAEVSTPDTQESLAQQLSTASRGYQAILDALNNGRRKKDFLAAVSDETIAAEFEAWFTEDKLAYVVAAQESDPEIRFTLVATPNVLVSDKELAKAAKDFGKNQPYETYVWDPLYSRYTPEQLSGTDPSNGKSVAFSLIPSKCTPGMDGTVVEQRAELAKLQADTPLASSLDLKVPSPLEAVTYWQTLRAQGDRLADGSTFNRTYIRHFNLAEQRLEGGLYVPYSFVADVGQPSLVSSNALLGVHARVAVG